MAGNKFIDELIRQLGRKKPEGTSLGPVQDDVFSAIRRRNPDFVEPEYVVTGNDVRHLQKSRMEKPPQKYKMDPEEIGDMINSLVTSTRARDVTAKNAYPQGVIVPHGEETFFGVLRPENGKVGIQTAYDPKTESLPKKLGSEFFEQTNFKDWVGARLPSNYAPREGGREFTQRQLSAVESLSGENDTASKNKVKALLPYVFGGSLAAGMAPGDAQAAPLPFAGPSRDRMSAWDALQAAGVVTPDLPLEQPVFDPVDNIIALLTGPAGVGGKAAGSGGSVNDQFNAAMDDTAAGRFGDAAGGAAGIPGALGGDTPSTPQNNTGGGAAPLPVAAALGGAGLGAAASTVIKRKKKGQRSLLSDIGQALFDPGGFVIPGLTGTDSWFLGYDKLTGGK